MDNLDTFIKKLNEDKVFKTLKALNKELNEDADFISKIQKYKLDTNNIDLKKDILNDTRYLKYKDLDAIDYKKKKDSKISFFIIYLL